MEDVMIDVSSNYIVAAYAVSGISLLSLIVWSIIRQKTAQRRLDALEAEQSGHDA